MAQTKSVHRSALVSLVAAASICGASLSGVANFRDIGGYQTSDGRAIKANTIYRSGELSGTTPPDQRVLQSLQIRYEIDLRTNKERAESPTRWGKNPPELIAISVGESRNDTSRSLGNSAELRDMEGARRFMQQTTARLALDGAGEIGQVLRRLAEGDEPALIHCTAGKDRTGVTIAVLMTLLQVPRDQVLREYAKSNESVDQQIERENQRKRAGAVSPLPSLPGPVRRMVMGAEPGYLEAAFRAIDKEYGSFEAYTANGLKITPEQIQALRTKLLEPSRK